MNDTMNSQNYRTETATGTPSVIARIATTKLPTYATAVGVSAAEVASVEADNLFFQYVCDARNQLNQYAKDWTAYKNGARSGPTLGDMPTPPTLAAPPAMVEPNIFGRIMALVARLKKHPGYTDAMSQDLDIIGDEQTVDLNTMKPVLQARPASRPSQRGLDQARHERPGDLGGPRQRRLRVPGAGYLFPITSTPLPCPPRAPARYGNTKPSIASTTNQSANGATWPASV